MHRQKQEQKDSLEVLCIFRVTNKLIQKAQISVFLIQNLKIKKGFEIKNKSLILEIKARSYKIDTTEPPLVHHKKAERTQTYTHGRKTNTHKPFARN